MLPDGPVRRSAVTAKVEEPLSNATLKAPTAERVELPNQPFPQNRPIGAQHEYLLHLFYPYAGITVVK